MNVLHSPWIFRTLPVIRDWNKSGRAFTTLKRGGEKNGFQVECIVYNGGHQFDSGRELLPYRLLTFNQR